MEQTKILQSILNNNPSLNHLPFYSTLGKNIVIKKTKVNILIYLKKLF